MSPFDEFYFYGIRILAAMVLMVMFTITCFTFGVAVEVHDQRELRCINAACEKPCDEVKKFKRHEGCKS